MVALITTYSITDFATALENAPYIIHDNGGRPFRVEFIIHDSSLETHVINNYDNSRDYQPNEIICNYPAYEVFVGKSPRNAMTEFSGGHGPRFDGNSMLFRVNERNDITNDYLYVGRSIYAFETIAPIKEYVSGVGNSDVPYPYAVDELGNTYLMLDGVIMLAEQNPRSEVISEPYDFYYDKQLITADTGRIPPRQPLRTYFGITEWYCNGELYTCDLSINPAEAYDNYVERLKDEDEQETGMEMTINGVRQQITKERYVELMTNIAGEMGFVAFANKRMICARNETVWRLDTNP